MTAHSTVSCHSAKVRQAVDSVTSDASLSCPDAPLPNAIEKDVL